MRKYYKLSQVLIPALGCGISVQPPSGSYLCIAPRSGLTIKKHINTLAGVIDPDYTGYIGVVLYNLGTQSLTIKYILTLHLTPKQRFHLPYDLQKLLMRQLRLIISLPTSISAWICHSILI